MTWMQRSIGLMQRPCREPYRRLPGDGASQLSRIRSEDKELFVRTRRAIALLAEQPYPDGAFAWGATGIYRLHTDELRVLYEVDDEASTVYIINIGLIS